jgi:hypothetical protein
MWAPTSGTQDRVIKKIHGTRQGATAMTMTPDPFLSAEIEYRQHHLAEQYSPRGRRHWVPRRPTMKLPSSGRRLVALAFGD